MYQENSVDDDLLNEGRRNLRDYLQTKGYFDATVEVERQPKPENSHLDIVYKIDPGVTSQAGRGEAGGQQVLRHGIHSRAHGGCSPSSFVLTNGRFSQQLLTEDVSSIKYLYLANGFLEVKVSAELVDNFEGKKDEMEVLLKIDEGKQTLVGRLCSWRAPAVSTANSLEPRLTNVEGQPFSEANIATDRDAITYYYYNHGFPNVQFEAAATSGCRECRSA